jgi:hypothetical protein
MQFGILRNGVDEFFLRHRTHSSKTPNYIVVINGLYRGQKPIEATERTNF